MPCIDIDPGQHSPAGAVLRAIDAPRGLPPPPARNRRRLENLDIPHQYGGSPIWSTIPRFWSSQIPAEQMP